MLRNYFIGLIVVSLSLTSAFAESRISIDKPRGELLYQNECDQCHTQQIHWQDKRIATNWDSLVAQVDRWQRNAELQWSKNDIEAVSLYLNDKFYHYR